MCKTLTPYCLAAALLAPALAVREARADFQCTCPELKLSLRQPTAPPGACEGDEFTIRTGLDIDRSDPNVNRELQTATICQKIFLKLVDAAGKDDGQIVSVAVNSPDRFKIAISGNTATITQLCDIVFSGGPPCPNGPCKDAVEDFNKTFLSTIDVKVKFAKAGMKKLIVELQKFVVCLPISETQRKCCTCSGSSEIPLQVKSVSLKAPPIVCVNETLPVTVTADPNEEATVRIEPSEKARLRLDDKPGTDGAVSLMKVQTPATIFVVGIQPSDANNDVTITVTGDTSGCKAKATLTVVQLIRVTHTPDRKTFCLHAGAGGTKTVDITFRAETKPAGHKVTWEFKDLTAVTTPPPSEPATQWTTAFKKNGTMTVKAKCGPGEATDTVQVIDAFTVVAEPMVACLKEVITFTAKTCKVNPDGSESFGAADDTHWDITMGAQKVFPKTFPDGPSITLRGFESSDADNDIEVKGTQKSTGASDTETVTVVEVTNLKNQPAGTAVDGLSGVYCIDKKTGETVLITFTAKTKPEGHGDKLTWTLDGGGAINNPPSSGLTWVTAFKTEGTKTITVKCGDFSKRSVAIHVVDEYTIIPNPAVVCLNTQQIFTAVGCTGTGIAPVASNWKLTPPGLGILVGGGPPNTSTATNVTSVTYQAEKLPANDDVIKLAAENAGDPTQKDEAKIRNADIINVMAKKGQNEAHKDQRLVVCADSDLVVLEAEVRPQNAVLPDFQWTVRSRLTGQADFGPESVFSTNLKDFFIPTEPGEFSFTAKCCPTCDGKTVTVVVVRVDIEVAGLQEDQEDVPGAFLCVNADDDNRNQIADLRETDIAGEDDLLPLELHIRPDGLTFGKAEVKITSGKERVRLWKTPTKVKGSEFKGTVDFGKGESLPKTLFLEGIKASDAMQDVTITLSFEDNAVSCSDSLNVTVVAPLLSIEGVPDEKKDTEGGFVCLNKDDDNKDGIPDLNQNPVPGEDDLIQLTLTVKPQLTEGMVEVKADPGIQLWSDSTKTTKLEFLEPLRAGDLSKKPLVFFAEGVTGGSISMIRATLKLNNLTCVDVAKLSVVSVQFVNVAAPFAERERIGFFDPNPVVTLDDLPDPGSGDNPQVTVKGKITFFIAPIFADHIFINGVPAASATLISQGPDGQGPFTVTFQSKPLNIGNDDFEIAAAAINVANDIGYASMNIVVKRSEDGAITGRTVKKEVSVPAGSADPVAFMNSFGFRIEVRHPGLKGNKVEVMFNAGAESKPVKLSRQPEGDVFRSMILFLVYEHAALTGNIPAKVKETRFRSKFGAFLDASYKLDKRTCSARAIPIGIRLVKNDEPLFLVQSGIEKDVTDAAPDITFTIEAGASGRDGQEIIPTVSSLGRNLVELPKPKPEEQFPPISITGDDVKLTRVSNDPGSPEFNLYKASATKPLIAIRTRFPLDETGQPKKNQKIAPIFCNYRGYISVSFVKDAIGPVRPVFGLQTLVAKPQDLTSEDLNPPFAEDDFIPAFNASPLVLITSPADGGVGTSLDQTIRGEVISFVNKLVAANLTVNGVAVSSISQDPNNPTTGPWRATFQGNVHLDMDLFTVVISAFDAQRNVGQDAVTFTVARNAARVITGISAANGNTLPTSNVVMALVDNNTVTLKEALAFLRNRQFRIEGNPILRGNLPFMLDLDKLTLNRQTDAAGTLTGAARDFKLSGGGFATARLILLPPQRDATFAPSETQDVANLGEFVRATTSVAPIRAETASPTGALFYDGGNVPVDAVVPGAQADIGGAAAVIADIRLFARIGNSGFDPSTGQGRKTIMATLQSLQNDGAVLPPPAPLQLPTTQWINFAPVAQDLTLTRFSDDPNNPRFHLYRLLRTGTVDTEEPVTPVSTGTFPAAAMQTPAQVLAGDQGIQHVQPSGFFRLSTTALAEGTVHDPVLGAFLTRTVTTVTDNAGNEIGFDNDRDFAIQLRERPVCKIEIAAAPGRPSNFLLRIERTTVNPATDLVPAGSDGFEAVAFLDVDAAAGHQHQRLIGGSGSYRMPPTNAAFGTLIRVGRDPTFSSGAPLGVRQEKFEGLNLPNLAIPLTAPPGGGAGATTRALPPQRYWLRPVMQSPNNPARLVLGNTQTVTMPYIVRMNFTAAFTADLNNFFRLVHPGLAPPVRTALQNAYISQITTLTRRPYNIHTGNDGRGIYDMTSVGIVIIAPANLQPALSDYVITVDIGGIHAAGAGLFGVSLIDVLNSSITAMDLSAPQGVFPRAFLGQFGVQGNSIFNPFSASPVTAFGAVLGDDPNVIINALSAGVATAPGALTNRNDQALNATVSFCRLVAGTISHEVGHTLGLVADRALVVGGGGYTATHLLPAARANMFQVGSDADFHNGTVAGVVGTLPTVAAAVAGVGPVDDLNLLPASTQNLLMDAGINRSLNERVEAAESGVIAAPPFMPHEPRATFFARNLQYLQTVLPRAQN